jgi:polar amino acid transport system substrate-binding protein
MSPCETTYWIEVEDLVLRTRRMSSLLSLFLVVLLAGCSTLGIGGSTANRIKRSGELRVAMAGDYPPMNVRTAGGKLIGLDADLASALAAILQVELVLVQKPFGELIEAVRSGDVDIAISGITMTPQRNLEVPFAGPYYLSRKAILGTPAQLEDITAVHQLHGRFLKVAAVSGSTSEALVKRVLPSATHLFVANHDDAIALVLRGEADVMVADDPVIRLALLRNPDSGLTFVESDFSAQPIGIAVTPGDPLFVNLIENYLRSLEHIGVLDRFRKKWFDNSDWLSRVE